MSERRWRPSLGILCAGAVAFFCSSVAIGQKQPQTYGGLEVCSRPGDRCGTADKSFDRFELPFRLPKRLKANALYKSVPFYAVVLRENADAPCDGGEYSVAMERFRAGAQTRFPGKKVFADHQCPNMAAVSYDFIGEKRGDRMLSFVGVYAGKTATEGRATLQAAKRHYGKATLHRMTVSYSPIAQ